jgi:hypothetical protein
MAKKKVEYRVVVEYPFKEYDHDVDAFISESFKLYGIRESGSGTDFRTRDVDGYCDSLDSVRELEKYLAEFPFSFLVTSYEAA